MLDVLYSAFDLGSLAPFLAPVLAIFVILGVLSLVRRCFR